MEKEENLKTDTNSVPEENSEDIKSDIDKENFNVEKEDSDKDETLQKTVGEASEEIEIPQGRLQMLKHSAGLTSTIPFKLEVASLSFNALNSLYPGR